MCIGPAGQRSAIQRRSSERDGAQRMRRDAERRVGQAGDRPRARLDQALEAVAIVEEPALPRHRRRAAEIALCVVDRQQGQPDAGLGRRGRDALRRLGDVGVGAPVRAHDAGSGTRRRP